jgi:hypothetical protein
MLFTKVYLEFSRDYKIFFFFFGRGTIKSYITYFLNFLLLKIIFSELSLAWGKESLGGGRKRIFLNFIICLVIFRLQFELQPGTGSLLCISIYGGAWFVLILLLFFLFFLFDTIALFVTFHYAYWKSYFKTFLVQEKIL